ncbi:hypothetical protein NONO_c20920 [Nocardia nova SH22a]|uniref:Novel STAND NTPase 3 domain-containing protein n=2 Tax=Nocardia nova TaxID=37330 RepID=W5TC39_9NOCA|nr:hypothetical protein NONO_c20920 [Nocardia nova SH22a]
MEEIQDRIRLYVATPSYTTARRMLATRNVCVITGAPGVGKSMLGDMLALTQWESGWQIISLQSHELDKCWDVWDPSRKQFFHFDDVFGQTDIHERMITNSGSTIARLIRRISATNNKQLVITTRTHILREARLHDESLYRTGLSANECIVSVKEYDRLHRARILYNHLYFCNIDRAVVRQFVSNNHHLTIISHRNFTPRLVEQTILQCEHDSTPERLYERMIRAMDHPVLLWGPSFTEFLTEVARRILLHLASYPLPGADAQQLRAASIRNATPLAYRRALTQLEGSWIKITSPPNSRPIVTFNDPSCRDFVLSFLESETDCVIDLILAATDAVQISQILNYSRSGINISLKYPSMNRAIVTNRTKVSDAIRNSWETWSNLQHEYPVETLHSLSLADSAFDLGLSRWIAERVLQLGSRFTNLHSSDAAAMGALSALLVDTEIRPSTSDQFNGSRMLLCGWWSAIQEDAEWDASIEFMSWLQNCGDTEIQNEMDAELKSSFDQWLDNELELTLANSTDATEARASGQSLIRLAERHFTPDEFSITFEAFRERVTNQWDEVIEYHESDDDEVAWHINAATDFPMEVTPTNPASAVIGYSSPEDRKIAAWFSQLL